MKCRYIILIMVLVAVSGQPFCSATSPKPNILFCIADDASMKSFGAYGCTYVKTPAIDRLAAGGARFRNAYNYNPKCSPARALLFVTISREHSKRGAGYV